LKIDAEVLLSDVTYRAIKELNLLGPFGQENPSPVFASGQVVLAKPAATMGEGDRHLNVQFKQNGTQLRAIAFSRGEWAEELNQHSGPFMISFEPMINSFRGRESVELRLLDWKSHEPAATH